MSAAILPAVAIDNGAKDLRREEQFKRVRAFSVVAPLLVLTLVMFIAPLVDMLSRSVRDDSVAQAIPRTLHVLESWSASDGVPPEDAFRALAAELAQSSNGPATWGTVARQLNFEWPGARGVVQKAFRRSMLAPPSSWREAFAELSPEWEDPAFWAALKRVGQPLSLRQYAYAVDLRLDQNDQLKLAPDEQRLYVGLFWRTFWVSAGVTLFCALLAYPLAYLLASSSAKVAGLLLMLVLMPFWTSVLVRTSGWIVLLQDQGVVNDLLIWAGAVSDATKPSLNNNLFATFVAMSQILLPFIVLPIFSVMKTIPPTYLRAARSLGAPPLYCFLRVYFPMTLPGVAAGMSLVFIQAVGFYVTPALVGGQSGQLISAMISHHMQSSLNWGLAAAVSVLLLSAVLTLYWISRRLVGPGPIKVAR